MNEPFVGTKEDKSVVSYSSPNDSWFRRKIIKLIELLSGKTILDQIYADLVNENPDPWNVWGKALNKLKIKIGYDERQLQKVPKTGALIFVANHPFGIVDGIVMMHLVTRVRKDYFMLVYKQLTELKIVGNHFLPVDFRKTPEARIITEQTKKATTEKLKQGHSLAIFPSGGVATRFGPFQPLSEFPWRKFICYKIHESKCTVVPMFFHGENSWFFHFISWFSVKLRLGLLIREALNKRGRTLKVSIGDPVTYETMQNYPNNQELIDFLRAETLALGKEPQ